MKVTRGSVERGNPRGASVQYSVQRYEEEENGKEIILIDALAGILRIITDAADIDMGMGQ